jgi:phenylacetate-CoA ligase
MIPDIELKEHHEIIRFQNEQLKKQIAYILAHSPFYQRKFKEEKIQAVDIQTIEDLRKISVTTKTDLYFYNDDFLCVPPSEIRDYAATSGTLGEPVSFFLNDNDLERLAYNEMLSFRCAGVQKGDLVQLMTTIDRRFMAGMAYFLGLRKLGAGIVRVGAGVPPMQWDSILRYKPRYVIAVPSFILTLIDYAIDNNIDYRSSSIEGIICIGEALRTSDLKPSLLAKKIQEKWPVKLYSTYASTEMSTAFTECDAFKGGHEHPELIITEILDEHDQPVAPGELGELVITTLGVEAMPLLRFKTGDLVRKHETPCICGRNTCRLGPVEGRKEHMIKYKGTTLYPPAMHDAVAHFSEVKLHLIEISTNELGTDEILIRIYTTDTSEEFAIKLKDYFRARLRVTPHISFEDEETLHKIIYNPHSRKPIFFVDKRTQTMG